MEMNEILWELAPTPESRVFRSSVLPVSTKEPDSQVPERVETLDGPGYSVP